MTSKTILKKLESLGSEGTKKTLMRHGAREPLFGVKIGDLQKLRREIGPNHSIALELYDSGNYDAMYLASFLAEDEKLTKTQLRKWAKKAYGASLTGTVVPSVACGNPRGWELALEWIDSKQENQTEVGWATLSHIVSVHPDSDLDIPQLRKLMRRVKKEIHKAPNDVRYAMNNFIIAVGSFVESLFDDALSIAENIGPVKVNHGDTSCKTPSAPDYLRKVESMGRVGKKKKSAKC